MHDSRSVGRRVRLIAMTLVAFVFVSAGPASGDSFKELLFDVDGVLPSADPDIEYFSSVPLAEALVFSAEGGFLRQRSFGLGVGSFSYNSVSGYTMDPLLGIAMESRLKIIRGQAAPPEDLGGAVFQVLDGNYRYTLFLNENSVKLAGSDAVAMDTSDFHVYRLESPGSSDEVRLFIDDALVITGTAPENGQNIFTFGDGITSNGNNADVDWDYITVANGIDTALPHGVSAAAPAILDHPAPNPFNPRTKVSFSLPTAGPADVAIHAPDGRLVATLASGEFGAGHHSRYWDGRDSRGREMSSGVYLVRLTTVSGVLSRRAVLLK